MRAWVTQEGAVGEVQLRRGLPRQFDQAALDAVRRWRFTPAEQCGRPVAVGVSVPVRFRLH